jgi:CheY-like chemotaxis protein
MSVRVTDQTRPGRCSPTDGGMDGIEGLRVLYAEDHPAMQRAVGRLLRVSGASVASARDGLRATERALAETFYLVLMDLRMPRMDGFEAARALRARGCRVPLVAVTADVTPAVRANALAAGFDAVLPKPFGLSDLILALRIAGRAARRDSSPA